MEYLVYKLKFENGVHWGNGSLDRSDYIFSADVLFSALYIEALKLGLEKQFFEKTSEGEIVFSDAFPYLGEILTIPKPMLYIEQKEEEIDTDRKKFKNMKYIPIGWLEEWVNGTLKDVDNPMDELGTHSQYTKAFVRREETQPYHVGVYRFAPENGVYIIVGYEKEEDIELLEELLESLSYAGIGGKKSSGLVRFEFKRTKREIEPLIRALNEKSGIQMLLSSALPGEEELESAMQNASYLLEKKSGFVASREYALEYRRKRDLYVFSAGSCFEHTFSGEIVDVSNGGNHPVYRYAKAMFMGVKP